MWKGPVVSVVTRRSGVTSFPADLFVGATRSLLVVGRMGSQAAGPGRGSTRPHHDAAPCCRPSQPSLRGWFSSGTTPTPPSSSPGGARQVRVLTCAPKIDSCTESFAFQLPSYPSSLSLSPNSESTFSSLSLTPTCIKQIPVFPPLPLPHHISN